MDENDQVHETPVVHEMAERSSPPSTSQGTGGSRTQVHPPVKTTRDALFDTGKDPRRVYRRLFEIFFYFLLCTTTMLGAYFIARGFKSSADSRRFDPLTWYPPVMTAIGCGNAMALLWHFFVRCKPKRAVIAAYWLSPLMTCTAGIMIMTIDKAMSLGVGIPLTVVGIAQAGYFVWVAPRLNYTMQLVSAATNVLPDLTLPLIVFALVAATLYSSVLGLAIAGLAAVGSSWDALAISGFVLSLLWTLYTIKNIVQTIIDRVKYKIFAKDQSIPTLWAIGDTLKYLVGTVALGSAVVPVIIVLVLPVKVTRPVLRKLGKFMSSFADSCYHVSTMLLANGNHYGFVYAGAYNRGFVQASRAAWQLLEGAEINELVESDETGSFSFFSGLMGGATSALVVGCWMRVTHQDHVPEISAFALLIGYQMCQIGTVWAQASVSAYYIAYVENPQSPQFETTIRARLEEMRKSHVPLLELELSNRQM